MCSLLEREGKNPLLSMHKVLPSRGGRALATSVFPFRPLLPAQAPQAAWMWLQTCRYGRTWAGVELGPPESTGVSCCPRPVGVKQAALCVLQHRWEGVTS